MSILLHRISARGENLMSVVSGQAALGAFVATALMLGAGAGPASGVPPTAQSLSVMNAAQWNYLVDVARSCRDQVLDDALDAVGDATARLKQV
jgi:hypothetical protein